MIYRVMQHELSEDEAAFSALLNELADLQADNELIDMVANRRDTIRALLARKEHA